MAIDAGEAAIRMVIASVLAEHGEIGGRPFDALAAMRQAEAIVRALAVAGYEIKRGGQPGNDPGAGTEVVRTLAYVCPGGARNGRAD
jgi:hypothetical protein